MSIVTKTVTINPAFLQEIKQDDVLLGALLENALEVCEISQDVDGLPQRFATLMEELRDQLAMHFALEEAYGYFDEPVNVAPHLSDKALALRDQHSELYEEISKLAENAADICAKNLTPRERFRKLRKRFVCMRNFHRRLADHEAAEIDLILNAYQVDIGGDG